jgi:hypothetical protein
MLKAWMISSALHHSGADISYQNIESGIMSNNVNAQPLQCYLSGFMFVVCEMRCAVLDTMSRSEPSCTNSTASASSKASPAC